MRRRRPFDLAPEAIPAIVLILVASPAFADAARGQTIFNQWCAACHVPRSGDPVQAGAGNPGAIANALDTVPDMQVVRTFVTNADTFDIADYLAVRFGLPPPPSPPPPPPPPPPSPPAPPPPPPPAPPPPPPEPPPPEPPPGTSAERLVAVEFHHAALDHYFVSAIADEIAALDAGTAIRGWRRTGFRFPVWSSTAGVANASPVCRFYIPPGNGDSHFYSASPAECSDVRVRFPQFTYEAAEVMAVYLPDPTTGACPSATTPVYRLWNGRTDSNHRYTTSVDVRMQMLGAGFVAEGYGPLGVAFCAPQ